MKPIAKMSRAELAAYIQSHLREKGIESVLTGGSAVSKIDTLEYETGTLRIISPADCVKDRLAAYYHWGDRQSLTQATLVLQENRIDLSDVAAWSHGEGMLTEFEKIEPLLREASAQAS